MVMKDSFKNREFTFFSAVAILSSIGKASGIRSTSGTEKRVRLWKSGCVPAAESIYDCEQAVENEEATEIRVGFSGWVNVNLHYNSFSKDKNKNKIIKIHFCPSIFFLGQVSV